MRSSQLAWCALLLALLPACAGAQEAVPEDTIPTDSGPLVIGLVGHGSLYFRFAGKVLHVDPVTREADYSRLPAADLVLITHEHGDHLDPKAVELVRKPGTIVLVAAPAAGRIEGAEVMRNGESRTVAGLRIEAVPAYNVVHKRPGGEPYHPRGQGNGYIVSFSGMRVYIAGDTEDTPEMRALEDIDVAFLPMNLPYTMTPEMVATAAKAFRPRILYPYHFGDTDTQRLVTLLADAPGIEVRVRELK